jgi:hypothetical protein
MSDRILTVEQLISELEKYDYKELHTHHTWKPAHSSFNGNNGLELQASMRRTHINTNGWTDIGQHVTLLPNGLFVTGRDFGVKPASISGYNTGAFACEILGNFDTPGTGQPNELGNDVFGGTQKDSMLKLAKYFNDKGRYIRFHRENSPKTCPGTSIDKDTFMNEVKSYGVTPIEVKPVEVKQAPKSLGNVRVKEFQELCNVLRVANLVVDGIVGPLTRSAVSKLPIIKLGSNNDRAVRVIQLVVGVNIDSIFGSKTLAAVKSFQSKHGLVADGIVGPKTFSKMLEVVS